MSDLRELLGAETQRRVPAHAPAFASLVKRSRRRRAVKLAGTCAVIGALGVGGFAIASADNPRKGLTPDAVASKPTSRSQPLIASTEAWTGRRDAIIATSSSGYVYLSDPVDVGADGTYTLTFHVAKSFELGTPIGLQVPPDSFFELHFAPPPKLSPAADGTQTLEVPITVKGNDSGTYRGFRAWLS